MHWGAWLVFGVPHLIVHLTHLAMFGTADRIGNVGALGGTVVLAALLLVPASDRARVVAELALRARRGAEFAS